MGIREAIKKQGYSLAGYARSRGLDEHSLHKVLSGEQLGKRRGQARECLVALHRDGLLPPEHPSYQLVSGLAKEVA
jgi:hypothetical protein